MARPTEDELIARYFAPLAGPAGLALQDDAALFAPPPGRELVLTVDASVAGIHFLPDDPPETIGWKALAVNLSDLAAKGAEPAGFLLALALPDDWTEAWLAGFAAGLGRLAREAGCPLLGGDTVKAAGALTVSITAIGTVPAGAMVRRTTARPGDLVCVTGTIGDAVLGLPLAAGERPDWSRALGEDERAFLVDRYRRPQPRLALAAALRAHASAAMDVSDGLVGDLAKLLRASRVAGTPGVTGTLDLDRIPLSPAAEAALAWPVVAGAAKQPDTAAQAAPGSLRRDAPRHAEIGDAGAAPPAPTLLDRIAGGGDDYEILFTLPPGHLAAMTREAAALGLAVTVVGEVRDGEEPLALRLNGAAYALAAPSFQHFR